MIKIRGIITKVYLDTYKVKLENEYTNCTARGLLKLGKNKILVGDIVEVNNNQIEKIYPRKNEFIRPPIANIDQLIIVISIANPKPDLQLLDKQLIMAENKNVEPIICINKIDLSEEYDRIIETYENIGYQVITTNAKTGEGINKIAILLNNKITAFTGNSGVGKSALTNNLFNKTISEEGETSKKLEKGKHTTKYVELYEITKNTYIADTPGFSTYDVQGITYKDLDKHFIEFVKYIPHCKYRGCAHIKEEGCAVKKAVEKRQISKERYSRYCELYKKLKEEKKW